MEMVSDETKVVFRLYLSYANINACDSRRIGVIKFINPYGVRVRKIAP